MKSLNMLSNFELEGQSMRTVVASLVYTVMAAVLVAATTLGVHAQSSQGSLRGVVKDAQGVIPGVTVVLQNQANNVSRDTVTNGSGEYSFPAVEPGIYTVTASVPGFKTFKQAGIQISTQQGAGLDVTLEVGALEETITVSAQAPMIETTNASTGGVVDAKTLDSIPTPGRSVFLMANLEPTVQTSDNAHWNRMQDQQGNSALSMGGGAVRSNNFLVEGFPITDLQNRASTNPSMEAVQEMKVQVHTYDAEMGRTGGGVMNMSARSGTNQWHGSGYTVIRPKSTVGQLLIPKLQGRANVPEEWRNGGGGGGGPIVKNKTFVWFAGEKYTDNQPQQNSYLVPTAAELTGDFSGLTRNGQPVFIRDPLASGACGMFTGGPGCFPGNRIPASRLDSVGLKIASYLPPADNQVDNGSSNFSMTDLLPNKAYQFTTKVDHHFNNAVALSGFFLRQVTHEASANYNPVNKFVGGSYQLDRDIDTFVLNNTYVVNSTTVVTLRGGYNKFNDNYNLPYEFDAGALFNNAAFVSQASDTNRFPTTTISGYKGTGFTSRQANGYYQYGANGALSKLSGTHNFKFGGDYRVLGATSLNYGASTGNFNFTDGLTNNSLASLLLGYPANGDIPLNAELDGFVRYYAGFAQDDWRVNGRFTINYGVRLERETGMIEKNDQQTVYFDKNAVSPLNSQVNVIDPLSGARRTLTGGLVYAGVDGAPREQGNQPELKVAPRVGAVFSFNDKTVLRGGWGLYYAPWNYAAAGTTGWGQIGYSATTTFNQTTVPSVSLSNPFPNGLVQPSGSSRGLLTGTGGDVYFVDPDKGAPRVQQFSADLQRELPGAMTLTLAYSGLKGSNLSWGGTQNALININQIDPAYLGKIANTLALTANPFQGVADAGQFANRSTIEVGQLLRPYPQFGNVYMQQSTGAHSMYNAAIVQLRKRTTGLWGGNFSYTYSRLKDNQFAQNNYYSSNPGVQDNYSVIPGSPTYNPDAEYGRSILDSPHKVVIAPTLQLPFGEGAKYLSTSRIGNILLGGWSITPVVTFLSGFPIGVRQELTAGRSFLLGDCGTTTACAGNLRPNVVPGADFGVDGDITDRIRGNVSDNLYLNKAAFTTSPVDQFGNAPRLLPGVASPWRNNVDLSVGKNVPTWRSTSATVRLEVLNVFNQVQWAAPASTAFGNSSFGQINNQANNMRMLQVTLRFAF